ncbi:MAG: hypothetical protein J6C85_06620 [Alphaproteobacteria bacterium]|nr:hypothetical protein [Alphaproteobacteria bacterium]
MKLSALLLIPLLASCGTLVNGSSQDIQFSSNVPGVEIYINGMKACTTPCIFPVDRNSATVVINAKKRGYADQNTMLRSQLSGAAVLNLTFWPSWLTDVASGGMWQYNRNGVYIEMEGAAPNLTPSYGYYGRYSRLQDAQTRRFCLFNFQALKNEASIGKEGEYIKALVSLSKKDEKSLISIINKANSEVGLAHAVTGIK